MNFDLSKLLESSLRTAFAVMVACCVLLFFPEIWLPFDISTLREQYGIWLFITLAVFVAIMLSYLAEWFCNFIKEKYKTYQLWCGYKTIISCLSSKEKAFLKEKYNKDEPILMINLADPIHKHLQTLKIISLNVGLNAGQITAMSGFIQPWVFDLIKKKPKLFETEPEKSDSTETHKRKCTFI